MGLLEIHFHDSDVDFAWQFGPKTTGGKTVEGLTDGETGGDEPAEAVSIPIDGGESAGRGLLAVVALAVGGAIAVVAWRRRS